MRQIGFDDTIWKKSGKEIVLLVLLLFSLTLAQSGGEVEVIWGTFGASGESSGGGYSQTGSVGVTDGNEMSGGEYTVTEQSEASDDCIIDFHHFVSFSEHWDRSDCNEMNNWCDGADMDQLGEVDWYDLGYFVDEWLCFCPYGWPF